MEDLKLIKGSFLHTERGWFAVSALTCFQLKTMGYALHHLWQEESGFIWYVMSKDNQAVACTAQGNITPMQ